MALNQTKTAPGKKDPKKPEPASSVAPRLLHSTRNAKLSVRNMKAAVPGKRFAFAIGRMGNKPVMVIRGRSWPGVKNQMPKMKIDAPLRSGGWGEKFVHHTWGMLFHEGDRLVLECAKKPNTAIIKQTNSYFTHLKAGRPIHVLTIRKLKQDDMGDPDQLEDNVSDDLIEEEREPNLNEVDGEVELDIRDEFGEDADDSDSDTAVESDSDTIVDGNDESVSSIAVKDKVSDPIALTQEKSADDLVNYALRSAGISAERDVANNDLRDRILGALRRGVSREQLLLLLCRSDNVKTAVELAEQSEPRPIARDDAGIGEIANSMAAKGTIIGRERDFLADGEVGQITNIEKTVRQHWDKCPEKLATNIVEELISTFDSSFRDKDRVAVRKLLALPREKFSAAMVALKNLVPLVADWSIQREKAQKEIVHLRDQLYDEFKDDTAQALALSAAIARVNGLTEHLDEEIASGLDTLLNEDDPAMRKSMIEEMLGTVNAMAKFVGEDPLMSELDGNEIIPTMMVVSPLRDKITEIRALLLDVSAGSA
jgi:hypothetical protein